MKKLYLTLFLAISFVLVSAARGFADDYTFQKQIITDDKDTCQAFRVHENWFVTAAHCVKDCLKQCQVKIFLARGPLDVSVTIDEREVFIPKQYRKSDAQGRVTTQKMWDVALLHYVPKGYTFEYPEGGIAPREEFEQALKESKDFRVQWRGAIKPDIPVLHTYGGSNLMELNLTDNNLIVPLWEDGYMYPFADPKMVLYFGENKSLWGSDGFGVDHGNSGGAVMLQNGGVIGVATAKMDNHLPAYVREAFPTFGKANNFFVFNGFAPKTTLMFIKKTMARYGDRPMTKKLEKVMPSSDAPRP